MAINLIKKFLDANGNEQFIKGSLVVDETSGKTFEDLVADSSNFATEAGVNALIKPVKDSLNTFLTGSDNDNGTLDRLSELVAAIEQNKDSIDALTADKLVAGDIVNDLTSGGVDKVLSAEQGKQLKTLLDGIKNTPAETGIAYVENAEAEAVYNGKIIMVVTPYTAPAQG